MSKCSICGKEFKNDAGLSGHMRFSHPAAVSVDGGKVQDDLAELYGAVTRVNKRLNGVVEALNAHTEILKKVQLSLVDGMMPVVLKQIREADAVAMRAFAWAAALSHVSVDEADRLYRQTKQEANVGTIFESTPGSTPGSTPKC